MSAELQLRFAPIGFIYQKRHDDPEDYFDQLGKRWTKEELLSDLRFGSLATGLILKCEGYLPVVVVPDKKGQKVVPITEAL